MQDIAQLLREANCPYWSYCEPVSWLKSQTCSMDVCKHKLIYVIDENVFASKVLAFRNVLCCLTGWKWPAECTVRAAQISSGSLLNAHRARVNKAKGNRAPKHSWYLYVHQGPFHWLCGGAFCHVIAQYSKQYLILLIQGSTVPTREIYRLTKRAVLGKS